MSLLTVCNRIQDIVGASTLINNAPHIEAWPTALNSADLPIALTRPGAGSWPHDSIADIRGHRTYLTEVYVMPNAAGYYYEGIQTTLAIIQDLGPRFAADFQLAGSSSALVFDSEPKDRGLVILNYSGTDYRGTVIELEVIEDVSG